MKLKHILAASVALFPLAAAPAHSQAIPTPEVTPTATALQIPVPQGAQVLAELDGRDQDVLGVLKNFITGMSSPGGGGGDPFKGVLTDEQLRAILANIHHLHVVAFIPAAGAPNTDLLPFYEGPFQAEGGHRVAWLGAPGGPRVLMEGFGQAQGAGAAQGFAAVVQMSNGAAPGPAVVLRADGYPDMTVLGKLLRTYMSAQATQVRASGGGPVRTAPRPHAARPAVRH